MNSGYRHQSGIALVTVLVFLMVIAAMVVLRSGEHLGEIQLAAADAEVRRIDYVAQAGLQHALWRAQDNACTGDFTIPATNIGPDSYSAIGTGGASASTYSLSVDQDAWIRSDNPSDNKGTDNTLHVRFDGSDFEQPLYRFDLSTLPAGSRINSAVARFYVDGEHPEGPLTVHRVTADWTEADATWNSVGDKYETQPLAQIPAQPDKDVWVSINLTAQVQAWVNGQPNQGIVLMTAADGVHAMYVSREGGAGEQPQLEVVVGTGAASPLNIQATGTLETGVTHSLSRPIAVSLQPPSIFALQPGPTEGVDAYIWEFTKTTNYGTDDETWVARGTNNTALALFGFNLGALPADAKILSASLSLLRQSGNDPDVPVTAHRITNPWNEDFVTWNRRDNGINWDTAGGDIDSTVTATTRVGPAGNSRYEWDITSLVQDWTAGTHPNYGVALATALDGAFGERFFTSDRNEEDRRPSLAITYACECGAPCIAPQGAGNLLMVVVNPTTLVPGDAAKKALFESWGYTVNVLSESANAAAYAAAAAVNDAVFISESVNASQVGSKLANLSIGVVSQDGDYNSDLGIASGSSWPVGDEINVVDASHYITAMFPGGALEIYDAAMEGLTASGSMAPGAQQLASWGGAGALVALDTGAADTGGGTAAGRRVVLPLGRDNKFNLAYLNSNGRLMVQRAIAWAMGADAVSTANLLMVVINPGNLTVQEAAKRALIESWGYTVNLIDESDSQAEFRRGFSN